MKEKLMVIDGNSIMNRAFFALPLLTNNEGVYTNAVYGFFNILFKFLDEDKPNYLAVAFDVHAPTFRHRMYDEYKYGRPPMAEELRPQIPLVKEILEAMNIQCIEKAGYEADDILGTLSSHFEAKGFDVTLVSGDRDMLQLASGHTTIKIPKTKGGKTEVDVYTEKDVIEKIGLTPSEFIEYKGLWGDPSDNIPGVPSIGEKTALKIIQEYKTVEAAILNWENIKPKRASENLLEYKSRAILSKKLATIVRDVPLDIETGDFEVEGMYTEEARALFEKLGFKTLLKRFKNTGIEPEGNFIELADMGQIEKELQLALTQEYIAYNLVSLDGIVYGISVYYENAEGFFVPMNNFNRDVILGLFKNFFMSQNKKISLNSKFEKVYLSKFDIEIKNVVFDCSLGGYIINASKPTYEYDSIAQDFLGESYLSEEAIFGKGKSKKTAYGVEQSVFL
ncbi:MAG: DNA polymerase I, partial [Clostridiales bacterium]|nr:DNA polymerase I [Clostridiales bacterium]